MDFPPNINNNLEMRAQYDAAFRNDTPSTYKEGDLVWLSDHYTVARITNIDHDPDDPWFRVITRDISGLHTLYGYKAELLRHASSKWADVLADRRAKTSSVEDWINASHPDPEVKP